MKTKLAAGMAAIMLAHQGPAQAMGLRTFVALPVDKGGAVLRLQLEENKDKEQRRAILNLAYGLDRKHTLLFGLPYRLSPSGPDQFSDLNTLYRYTVLQNDFVSGTHRIGLLAGPVIPLEVNGDPAVQVGAVTTLFSGRHELDLNLLYLLGFDERPDQVRYDISWQYRLAPRKQPEWGIGREWNSVVELGGRKTEANDWVHQVTLGLQWIHPRWVLEGGVFEDINGPQDLHFIISTRFHF